MLYILELHYIFFLCICAHELNSSGNFFGAEEEITKEVFVEEDNDERLDLDDTELEYDPEEEPVEDNEKDIKNEVESAEGDPGEGEEEEEEYEQDDAVDEADEGEMVEEIESDGEDVEGNKDDEETEDAPVDAADNEEQHDVLTEHRKRKEFEVFVGGLDKEVTEDELKKFFSEVGQVMEVRLMKHPVTKKNKGFAFLRFSTVEEAKRAVAEMKSPVVIFMFPFKEQKRHS